MLEALAVLVLIALICTHEKLEGVRAFFASGILGTGLAVAFVAMGIWDIPFSPGKIGAWLVRRFLFGVVSPWVLGCLGYLSAWKTPIRYFGKFFFPLSFGAVLILWLYRNDLPLNPGTPAHLLVWLAILYAVYVVTRRYGAERLLEFKLNSAESGGMEAEGTHQAPDGEC
ncbi:MAG TPA: hypothetical protein VFC10_07160 [Terriglobia bacterium]|nr:hypothetical protein [Terriglobia bacterium]